MFSVSKQGDKFLVQYHHFDLVYTQPGVVFSTVEGAEKHKKALITNSNSGTFDFIQNHWDESKLVDGYSNTTFYVGLTN